MNKRQCIGLWHAKGWKLEAVQAAVQRKGFSRTSLSNMAQSTEPADPKFVELAWKAERYGPEEDFEIYWRGLASLGVEVPPELLAKLENPPPPTMDPEEIAGRLGSKLDTLLSAMGGKLDVMASALSARLEGAAATLRGKLDAFSLAVRAQLDAFAGKIDVVQATANHTDAKLDVLDAKLDRMKRQIITTVCAAMGLGVLAALPSCVASLSQRYLTPAPPMVCPSSSAPVIVNIGQGAVEEAGRAQRCAPPEPERFSGRAGSEIEQLGEKVPEDYWIPKEPLPNQKRPPCDRGLYQVAINNGCWFWPSNAKPPCGRLYRDGDKCYIPVAADPSTPVGEAPQRPGP